MTADEWRDLKATTPFGQIPILEVDGKRIAQSAAIGEQVASCLLCAAAAVTHDQHDASGSLQVATARMC